MRYLRFMLLPLLLVACTDTQPVAPDVDVAPSFKVDRFAWTFDADLITEPPYEDCATGESMQNYGGLRVYIRGKTTPSGNVVDHGWVDYEVLGPVTLVGENTGTVWTLANGHNPFSEVLKENGFYTLSYHWAELYKNSDGETLHIHLKGHFKTDKDGNVTIDRESYTCR